MTEAYVNQGRWVADCPDVDCSEAHKVAPGDWFGCSNCGAIAEVSFPDNHAQIDAVLSMRRVPQTRNWTDETVHDLEQENRQHGMDRA